MPVLPYLVYTNITILKRTKLSDLGLILNTTLKFWVWPSVVSRVLRLSIDSCVRKSQVVFRCCASCWIFLNFNDIFYLPVSLIATKFISLIFVDYYHYFFVDFDFVLHFDYAVKIFQIFLVSFNLVVPLLLF